MSIELRISDKPFIADIQFKDGTRRRIDYTRTTFTSGFFVFYADAEGLETCTFINADTVGSMDVDNAAQTVGMVM